MAKQQNKYSKWLLTVQCVKGSDLPEPSELKDCFERISCSKYVFQLEIGETEKEHYQCAFMTKDRIRQSTLVKKMAQIMERNPAQFQLNKQAGSWDENVTYCTKLKERVGEKFFSNFKIYDGSDLQMVVNQEQRRPFQQSIIEIVLNREETDFLPADSRTIYWIYDRTGGCGKSRVVKWFITKFPNRVATFSCNTDSQLRSAAIDAGARDLVFVDIPRATKYQDGYDEKMSNMLSVLEDIKNGCVSSAMYGKYRTLICAPCHVFVFSNTVAPCRMLTRDRWRECVISEDYQLKARTENLNLLLNERAKDLNLID